jgi:hypothetical protein
MPGKGQITIVKFFLGMGWGSELCEDVLHFPCYL